MLYNHLIYGVAIDGSNQIVEASPAFGNVELTILLFSTEGCLRENASTCLNTSSPYYSITHHGVDPLFNRYIEESHLFLSQEYNEMTLTSE